LNKDITGVPSQVDGPPGTLNVQAVMQLFYMTQHELMAASLKIAELEEKVRSLMRGE